MRVNDELKSEYGCIEVQQAATLQACLQACLECQRCHYVSWAVGDCSYFRSCAALTAGLQSHKTVRVRSEGGRILVPMPTPTTTPPAAARHDGPDGAALAAGALCGPRDRYAYGREAALAEASTGSKLVEIHRKIKSPLTHALSH